MMNTPSKKLFAAALSVLFLVVGLMSGSASAVDTVSVSSEVTAPEATPTLEMLTVTQMFPFPPALSSAWFTGTWCYISCSDGSFATVRAFSTSNCCSQCTDVCGFGCIAEGGGPSVLCDGY